MHHARDDSAQAARQTTCADAAAGESALPAEVSEALAHVLAATQRGVLQVSDRELVALLAVARHRHAEPAVGPGAADLVLAMLRAYYGRLRLSDMARATMATRIGQTLCEAPTTLPRMQRFWDQLRGVIG